MVERKLLHNDMSYGFIDNKFYIDLKPCSRSVGSVRQEFSERASFINNHYKNLILSFSCKYIYSGLLMPARTAHRSSSIPFLAGAADRVDLLADPALKAPSLILPLPDVRRLRRLSVRLV